MLLRDKRKRVIAGYLIELRVNCNYTWSKHEHVYVNVRRWYVWKKKKEKKADIVICTGFGKLSEGIWLAYLSMIVNMGKRDFEFNDDEYVDVDLLCVVMGMWVVWE